MAGAPDSAAGDTGGASADWRQLAIVALAALALLVAAFAVPPLADGQESPSEGQSPGAAESEGGAGSGGTSADGGGGDLRPGDGGDGTDGDGVAGDGGGDGAADGFEVRDPDGREIHPDEAPPLDPSDVRPALRDGCWVVAHSHPVPGTTLRVSVWEDHRPLPDRRVWFNGDLVGRTDQLGTVSGEVPYDRAFEVRVAVPNCRFVTADVDPVDQGPASLVPPNESTVGGDTLERPMHGRDASFAPGRSRSPGGRLQDRVDGAVASPDLVEGPVAAQTPDGNETVSNTYQLDGEIDLTVEGRPHPGATVTLGATLGGYPVADGRVTVAGSRVGRTDARGRYELRIPAAASGAIRVGLSRGDFDGQARIDVHDLAVSLRPARPLPVPGQRAVATVRIEEDPVTNATVTVAGDSVGRTGGNGEVAFTLPAGPAATVGVSAQGQEATAAVWPLFLPAAIALMVPLLAGGLLTRRAWRQGGRAAALRPAGATGGLEVVITGYVLGGGAVAALAAGAVALLGLAAIWWTSDPTAGDLFVGGSERVRTAVAYLRRAILRCVDILGDAIDRARALGRGLHTWIAAQPRSIAGLLERLAGWFRRGPTRVAARVQAGYRWLRRSAVARGRTHYTHRRLLVLAAGVALVAAASWRWGADGGLVAGLLLAGILAGSLLRRVRAGGDPEPGSAADPGGTVPPGGQAGSSSGSPRRSLRELWRRFARAVAPGRWRTRTPAEIARTAIDRGLPANPVGRLAAAFRAAEYGGRDLSEEEEGRARAAYRTVREALAGDAEEVETE